MKRIVWVLSVILLTVLNSVGKNAGIPREDTMQTDTTFLNHVLGIFE